MDHEAIARKQQKGRNAGVMSLGLIACCNQLLSDSGRAWAANSM
jgi:hypothetical protein